MESRFPLRQKQIHPLVIDTKINTSTSVTIFCVDEKRSPSNNVRQNTQDESESSQNEMENDDEKSDPQSTIKRDDSAFNRQKTKNLKLFSNRWTVRAFTTSCIILLVLIITYIPLSIIFVIENIRGLYSFQWRRAMFALPYLCSFLNPIIYFWRIPEFRKTVTEKYCIG